MKRSILGTFCSFISKLDFSQIWEYCKKTPSTITLDIRLVVKNLRTKLWKKTLKVSILGPIWAQFAAFWQFCGMDRVCPSESKIYEICFDVPQDHLNSPTLKKKVNIIFHSSAISNFILGLQWIQPHWLIDWLNSFCH